MLLHHAEKVKRNTKEVMEEQLNCTYIINGRVFICVTAVLHRTSFLFYFRSLAVIFSHNWAGTAGTGSRSLSRGWVTGFVWIGFGSSPTFRYRAHTSTFTYSWGCRCWHSGGYWCLHFASRFGVGCTHYSIYWNLILKLQSFNTVGRIRWLRG
jgi:hypothetical protein